MCARDIRSLQDIYMVCTGNCEGTKVGRPILLEGEECPFREGFLDEAMLANYWGFDIRQEDNGKRAFPIPGVLQTQHDS